MLIFYLFLLCLSCLDIMTSPPFLFPSECYKRYTVIVLFYQFRFISHIRALCHFSATCIFLELLAKLFLLGICSQLHLVWCPILSIFQVFSVFWQHSFEILIRFLGRFFCSLFSSDNFYAVSNFQNFCLLLYILAIFTHLLTY